MIGFEGMWFNWITLRLTYSDLIFLEYSIIRTQVWEPIHIPNYKVIVVIWMVDLLYRGVCSAVFSWMTAPPIKGVDNEEKYNTYESYLGMISSITLSVDVGMESVLCIMLSSSSLFGSTEE